MAYKVIITRKAQSQRLRILDYWYLRTGNKTYSSHLDKAFRRIFRFLANYSDMGHEIENGKYRIFIYKTYQIIYLTKEQELVILQIWDTRQNPERLRH